MNKLRFNQMESAAGSVIRTSILSVCFMLIASITTFAQNVVKIEASAEGTEISAIINADTVEAGWENRIYELERDAFYFVKTQINKTGAKLHIRAEAGDGLPPLLLPQQAENGNWPNMINHKGDLTMENIWTDNQNGDALNKLRPISVSGDGARIELVGVNFENARGSLLTITGNNTKIYIRDSRFARSGQRSVPGGNGRPIDIRDARPVDTLVVENSTMYMIMDRIVRTQGGSIGYFHMDHVTVFNHEGEHGGLQLGRVNEATIKNSLFIDAQWKGNHPNKNEQTQVEKDSHYIVTFDTVAAETKISIHHNNAAWSQLVKDYWTANSSLISAPKLIVESAAAVMGQEAYDGAFFSEFVELKEVPSLADYKDYMDGLFLDPRPDPFPRWMETDLIGAPFIDASYPTTSQSYTAAEGGLPLGDLNFFPDKKALWESTATSIEDLADLPDGFTLRPAYPNPFNPTTNLAFDLSTPAQVRYTVYSVLGQEVFSRDLGMRQAGTHSITYDAAGLPSGMYIVRMQAGDQMRSMMITLLK